MSQALQPPIQKSFYQQFIAMHEVPFYLLLGTYAISAFLIFAFWALSWALWQIGLLILLAWTPLVFVQVRSLVRQELWLALLFLLVVTQGAHTIEHLAQMVQIHLLGLKGAQARGIIGMLDIEWVHLIWNSWVLLLTGVLLYGLRDNKWLWMLFIFAIYHEIEHIYIVSIYVHTHIAGAPGLLAQGGLIGGGLPIARPDLHSLYAVFEEAMLVIAYMAHIRKTHLGAPGPAQA